MLVFLADTTLSILHYMILYDIVLYCIVLYYIQTDRASGQHVSSSKLQSVFSPTFPLSNSLVSFNWFRFVSFRLGFDKLFRNAGSGAGLVRPRERPPGGDTMAKNRVRVDPFRLPLRVDRRGFSSCCPSVGLPTSGTRPICCR